MNKTELYKKIEDHYRANYSEWVRLAQRSMGSIHGAEDAVQTAYTNALQHWTSEKEVRDFDSWMFVIFQNAIKKEQANSRILSTGSSDDAVEGPQISKLRIDEVLNLIAEEDLNRQTILKLHLIEGYTAPEINSVVPETLANVEKIITRFRQRLKAMGK